MIKARRLIFQLRELDGAYRRNRYPQHRLEHLPVLHPLRPSLAFKIISADKGFVLMVLEVGTALYRQRLAWE